jgi:hypothetical protein
VNTERVQSEYRTSTERVQSEYSEFEVIMECDVVGADCSTILRENEMIAK